MLFKYFFCFYSPFLYSIIFYNLMLCYYINNTFIASLQVYFAEFLKQRSSVHLYSFTTYFLELVGTVSFSNLIFPVLFLKNLHILAFLIDFYFHICLRGGAFPCLSIIYFGNLKFLMGKFYFPLLLILVLSHRILYLLFYYLFSI